MRARRRRDRGFSLLVVLMLITVMAGVAGTVILSTQQDLSVVGQDREALAAFYAAEDGVAQAKEWLAARLGDGGFVAGDCARREWTSLDASTRFSFCIHDERDLRHLITIEAWGVSATAQAHLAVEVASPSLATITWRQY